MSRESSAGSSTVHHKESLKSFYKSKERPRQQWGSEAPSKHATLTQHWFNVLCLLGADKDDQLAGPLRKTHLCFCACQVRIHKYVRRRPNSDPTLVQCLMFADKVDQPAGALRKTHLCFCACQVRRYKYAVDFLGVFLAVPVLPHPVGAQQQLVPDLARGRPAVRTVFTYLCLQSVQAVLVSQL